MLLLAAFLAAAGPHFTCFTGTTVHILTLLLLLPDLLLQDLAAHAPPTPIPTPSTAAPAASTGVGGVPQLGVTLGGGGGGERSGLALWFAAAFGDTPKVIEPASKARTIPRSLKCRRTARRPLTLLCHC